MLFWGFFRRMVIDRTQDNPKGCAANRRVQDTPFTQAALGLGEGKSFSDRFDELKELYSPFSLRLGSVDLPDAFVDPITQEIMNTPMIASDGRTYDKSTVEHYALIAI